MAVSNQLAKRPESKAGLTQFLNTPAVISNIEQAIGPKERQRFITGVISAVNTNPALKSCTNQSVLSGALLGESLKLSPSPQLGHYYLVPFKNKKENTEVAQFQLGYKGYIQLAIRSGQYKKLTVLDIKEGELISFDPFNEELQVKIIDDPDLREESKTIGYYAMFELVNGFRKAIYWSKRKMIRHADKYSPAFSAEATTGRYPKVSFADYEAGNYSPDDAWLYSSFWYKQFDDMAFKTMLRQLISKWGVMSVDMQMAFDRDMTFTDSAGNVEYEDAENYVDADYAQEPSNASVIDSEAVQAQTTTNSDKSENSGITQRSTGGARSVLFGGR